MSVDFPRAWQIARMALMEDHDPECSFRQTDGAVLCDCHVLTEHPEYKDDVLQGKDGVPCRSEAEEREEIGGLEARIRELEDALRAASVKHLCDSCGHQWGSVAHDGDENKCPMCLKAERDEALKKAEAAEARAAWVDRCKHMELGAAIKAGMKQAEELREARTEIERLKKLIHKDQTGLAGALDTVRQIVRGYGWLADDGGWASYSYEEQTEETLRREMGAMYEEVLGTIKKAMRKSGYRATAAFHPEGKIVNEDGERPEQEDVWRDLYFSQMALVSKAEKLILDFVERMKRLRAELVAERAHASGALAKLAALRLLCDDPDTEEVDGTAVPVLYPGDVEKILDSDVKPLRVKVVEAEGYVCGLSCAFELPEKDDHEVMIGYGYSYWSLICPEFKPGTDLLFVPMPGGEG